MAENTYEKSPLVATVNALRKDLLDESGPKISTMRTYRFAIMVYNPTKEFELRAQIRQLSDELKGMGWNVLSVSLQKLLLERLKAEDYQVIFRIIQREKRLYEKDPERALQHLKEKLTPYIEGPDGIAKDVIDVIDKFALEHPEEAERTLIFIGRAGALYPFFRYSALLKFIDGKTHNIPVVLLYPGERRDISGLSFMGELPPDRDYRPRIYS